MTADKFGAEYAKDQDVAIDDVALALSQCVTQNVIMSEALREANLSGCDTCRLVAPSDKETTGDKVAIGLSVCVLVWMLVSMLDWVWTL